MCPGRRSGAGRRAGWSPARRAGPGGARDRGRAQPARRRSRARRAAGAARYQPYQDAAARTDRSQAGSWSRAGLAGRRGEPDRPGQRCHRGLRPAGRWHRRALRRAGQRGDGGDGNAADPAAGVGGPAADRDARPATRWHGPGRPVAQRRRRVPGEGDRGGAGRGSRCGAARRSEVRRGAVRRRAPPPVQHRRAHDGSHDDRAGPAAACGEPARVCSCRHERVSERGGYVSLQWPPPPPPDLRQLLPAEPAVLPQEQAGRHSASASGPPDWPGPVGLSDPVPSGGLTDPRLIAGVSDITATMAAQLDDGASSEDVMPVIREAVRRWLESQVRSGLLPASAGGELDRLARAVHDRRYGLGPLSDYLRDPQGENVDVNGCDQVWITYASGERVAGPPVAASDDALIAMIRNWATRGGQTARDFSSAAPLVNVALTGSARLTATMAVTPRPCVSLRRHGQPDITLGGLVQLGTIDVTHAAFLGAAVRSRCNIIVTGGVNAGKTTLLRALASEIPPDERC